ncbi:MAG: hypothetical protein J0L92_37830, partial [Deltaproteobacteria bacterium]|nr:hypothetical protein [Deltaproteobacteria bacterium]
VAGVGGGGAPGSACVHAAECCRALAAAGTIDVSACSMFLMSSYPVSSCRDAMRSYGIALRTQGRDASACADPSAPPAPSIAPLGQESPGRVLAVSSSTEQRTTATAGGWVRGMDVRFECRGTFPREPQIRVDVGAGVSTVEIRLHSGADTTLLVRSSSGAIVCDDDGGDSLDAAVRMSAQPGETLSVFAGMYSGGSAQVEIEVRSRGR